jgi:hypothetical protein
MACPVCNDERGDGVCNACCHDGYVELGCGCIENPNGTRSACSEQHELCEVCGTAERQATDTVCGPCREKADQPDWTVALNIQRMVNTR